MTPLTRADVRSAAKIVFASISSGSELSRTAATGKRHHRSPRQRNMPRLTWRYRFVKAGQRQKFGGTGQVGLKGFRGERAGLDMKTTSGVAHAAGGAVAHRPSWSMNRHTQNRHLDATRHLPRPTASTS